MLSLVALLLVGAVGVTGAYWAYKKYRQKERQEFRFEFPMGNAMEGFDAKVFKSYILTDEVLDTVIKKNQLVSVWAVADEAAAKAIIREKFIVLIADGEVSVSYQGKDKDLSKAVLETIIDSYRAKLSAPSSIPASE